MCLLSIGSKEVENLSRLYTESGIKEAITKSLKGSAAEALRSLGPPAIVAEILIFMIGQYGVVAFYDSLMRDFYTLVQEENEKVPQLATKIEIKLSFITWNFPIDL